MKSMPPKEKTILPPKGGWKQSTFYIVEAAFSPTNPVHRYIFYTGFLNGVPKGHRWTDGMYPGNDIPGGYNQFLRIEDFTSYKDAHYLLPIHELANDHLHEGVSTFDDTYSLVEDYQPHCKELDE